MKNARALDRIAEYAELPLEDFVRERRLQAQQELVSMFTELWDMAMDKQLATIRLAGSWENCFEMNLRDMQGVLDEAKTLLLKIQCDTRLIEKMEADSHEQV